MFTPDHRFVPSHMTLDGSPICQLCGQLREVHTDADSVAAVVQRVQQTRQPHDYRFGLSDTERAALEQFSFNFFNMAGRRMRVPPRMYSDAKRAGVNVKWMEPDGSLEQ